MDKHSKNPKRVKDNKNDNDNDKKDLSTPKPRMKKPGDKGFRPHEETIGDGSAGMGGTSAI